MASFGLPIVVHVCSELQAVILFEEYTYMYVGVLYCKFGNFCCQIFLILLKASEKFAKHFVQGIVQVVKYFLQHMNKLVK